MVVAVKAKSGAAFFVSGPVGSVDQQNVLPAVAIVVKEGAAGAERLRQELATERSAVVLKVEAGGFGHIRKAKTNIRVCRLPHSRVQARQRWPTGQTSHSPQERPAIHGTFTSPERMA